MTNSQLRIVPTIEVRQCPGSGRWRVSPADRPQPPAAANESPGAPAWVAFIDERDDAVAYARTRLADFGGGSLRVVVDGQLQESIAVSAERAGARHAAAGAPGSFPWPPARAARAVASGA